MKLVQADAIGDLSAYHLVDHARQEPQKGEIRVAVHCCGMGYADALFAAGRYQIKPTGPFTPGHEYAGVVDAVGEGLTHLSVGERVMVSSLSGGGLAEYAVVPEQAALRIPDSMSFAQAASFRGNYLAALHALVDRGLLSEGEHLLIIGAAGGVGAAAIQIGRLLGATIVAAASTDQKRSFASSLGAHVVIDTEPSGWRERLKQVSGGAPDVIFDPVGGPLFELAFRSLKWRGRHLVVGFAAGSIPKLAANLPLMKGAALIGVDVRQFQEFEPDLAARHLNRLLDWFGSGDLIPPVGRRFAFPDYLAAMEFALSGQGSGKVVVEIE